MPLDPKLAAFYKQYSIVNGPDNRTVEQIQYQKSFVKDLTNKNLSNLKIKLTQKASKKYVIPALKRMNLDDGVYCYMSDNGIQSEQSVISIHGAPGTYSQWAGIEEQMKRQYRWINLMIPGFDGEDQRRGLYDGTINTFQILFDRLYAKLKLKRVIICAHSYGSTVGYHLANAYPQLIEGFINLAGLGNLWPTGMSYMFKAIISDDKLYEEEWKSKKLYDQDELRPSIYARYLQNYKSKHYQKLFIPILNQAEYFAFLKLTFHTPQHFSERLQKFSESQGLKVFCYGGSDPIYELERAQATIYFVLNNKQSYLFKPLNQKLFKLIKQPLETILKERMGIEIEGDRIQQYLCYIFDKTGHNLHMRRPSQLAKIIQVYLIALQVIYEYKPLLNSAL